MNSTDKIIRKTATGRYEITSHYLDDGTGRAIVPTFKTLRAARAYVIPAWAKRSAQAGRVGYGQ